MSLDSILVDTSDLTQCMLPFRLVFLANQFYVGPGISLLDGLRGSKIVTINGKPLIDHLQTALLAISGKSPTRRVAQLIDQQRTYWALFRPVGEDLVDLTVEDPNGRKQSYVIDLLSVTDYDTLLAPETPTQGDELQFYEGDRICHWQCNQSGSTDRDLRWLDRVLTTLRDRGTTHLILDLRHNRNGEIVWAQTLLSYLTDKPYRFHAQIDTKISKALRTQTAGKHPDAPLGKVVREVCERELPTVRETLFRGELFVLIGPGTCAGAADLAAVIKDYEMGNLIGEETGDLRETFGNSLSQTLPNRGLIFQVSTTTTYPPLPRPGDDKQGTVPDIEVTESLLAPHLHTPDPLLTFVLDTVRKRL
jgi:hypothetical protein